MIIRTDIETIVAAENPIADTPSQLLRKRGLAASKFNREVRNASPGIHDIGLGDRTCRTGLDAKRATAAQIGSGLVRIELQGRQNFSQQEP